MENTPRTTTTRTRTRPEETEKQRDGAKTLLDAVTAYQRRTARAERTAARNQVQSNSNPSPRPSQGDRHPPTDSAQDSADFGSHSQHSRRSSPPNPNFRQPRPGSSTVQTRKNHPGPSGRNSPRAFHDSYHSSKLFDPKLDSIRSSKRVSERNPPSRSSKPNPPHYHTLKGNPTQIEDQESSQSNPSQTSHLAASKSQPPHLRSISIQQDRDGKRKKEAARTRLNEPRQLFDPRKHDPVKFAASHRPTSESKLDPNSILSNDPADSSHIDKQNEFGHNPAEDEENSRNDLVIHLKMAYKRILSLETALKDEESAAKAKEEELRARGIREGLPFHSTTKNSTSASLLRNRNQQKRFNEDYWVKLSKQHRELAEAHQYFLEMALDPRLPPSMHSLPHKYNTPSRLWQIGFHQLLERLRHALPITTSTNSVDYENSSQRLLEHMTDFIYFAYGFYTALLEEQRLLLFKNVWIEQLGDLARYRMAVAGLMSKLVGHNLGNSDAKRSASTAQNPNDQVDSDSEQENIRPQPRGGHRSRQVDEDEASLVDGCTRLDLSSQGTSSQFALVTPKPVSPPRPKGSIGIAALDDWDFEEQEIWRATAKDWYAKGLADNPATGRLHHHLALLSKGDELKTLYHYCKSLTVSHPYLPARESILPFFEQEHQARRSRPEVSISDLFVHLHGMLFTKIQLDDFDSELARFIEKLTEDRLLSDKQGRARRELGRPLSDNLPQSTISNASWVMMATVNICAISQYGIDDGVIRVAQQNSYKSQDNARNSNNNKPASKGMSGQNKPVTIAPQAILLSHPSNNNPPVEQRKMSCSTSSDEGVSSMGNGVDPSWASNAHDHRDSTNNVGIDNVLDDEYQAILIKRPEVNEVDEEDEPIVFVLATKFTFEILKEVLQQNNFKDVCPYLTIVLTFLGSLSSNRRVMKKLEKFIPWDGLVSYFNRIPKSVLVRSPSSLYIQDSLPPPSTSPPSHLRISGFPLLEDWCLRGMDWAVKGLFGRGYWKQLKGRGATGVGSVGDSEKQPFDLPSDLRIDSELDALAALNGGLEVESCQLNGSTQQTSRQVQPSRIDLEEEETIEENGIEFAHRDSSPAINNNDGFPYSIPRWKRIGLVASWISTSVPGIECEKNVSVTASQVPMFIISHYLKQKISRWQAEFKQEEEERQLLKSQRISSRYTMEYEDEIDLAVDEEDEEDDDDPNDSELVKSLKARRRELIMLLNQTKNTSARPVTRKPKGGYQNNKSMERHQRTKNSNNSFTKLNVLAGYTTLVFDTNILIGMLSIVKDLLESEQFTIVVPLVVITELDGLKKKMSDSDLSSQKLGQEALEAIQYLEKSIAKFSKVLKIQTSRGNYLRDLSIRNERINFQGSEGDSDNNEFLTTNAARNLDDVVLRATSWQLDHFSNRLLSSYSSLQDPEDGQHHQQPEKVILLTLDRNLRLKARARGILAADEKQIIHLIGFIKQQQIQTNQKLGKKDV